jgi:hypothetical protein
MLVEHSVPKSQTQSGLIDKNPKRKPEVIEDTPMPTKTIKEKAVKPVKEKPVKEKPVAKQTLPEKKETVVSEDDKKQAMKERMAKLRAIKDANKAKKASEAVADTPAPAPEKRQRKKKEEEAPIAPVAVEEKPKRQRKKKEEVVA